MESLGSLRNITYVARATRERGVGENYLSIILTVPAHSPHGATFDAAYVK